jgi:hypothetical protein
VRHPVALLSCPRDAPLSCSRVWSSRCHRCRRIRLASLDTAHPKVCSLTSPCRQSTCHWARILLSRVLDSSVSSAWHRTSLLHARDLARSPPLGLASPGRPASVLAASVHLGLTTARTINLFAHTPSDFDRLTRFFVASVVLAPSDPCSYSPLRFRGVNRARVVKSVWDVRAQTIILLHSCFRRRGLLLHRLDHSRTAARHLGNCGRVPASVVVST